MTTQITNFEVMNPLAETIRQAEQIVGDLYAASEELENAIVDERDWYSRVKEAETTYEWAENEIVAEAVVNAKLGEGPLAGIAVSGKGHEIVINKLKNDARKDALANEWGVLCNRRKSYEAAQRDLLKAEARFNALRKIADVKANILRASSI